ncbi:MAG: choice-of-anchor L domain-containing protein [Flavobacteriaceae bacterium]
MIKKITLFILLISSSVYAQSISVDDTTYSATDLANLLLNGSCIDPTNISSSSSQSVAYFNQNGSTFPISEGIIIRTGNTKDTEGIYTNTNLSSQDNTNSDPDLQTISNDTGQSLPITDTAFLQFDFTPISSDFNFSFVFASNEYGQYQCGFSDVFAFLLTDTVTGITTNLAVLPGTTTPVSVLTIRDNAYNSGCTSENAGLFSTYNVDNPSASSLNMRGHTTVMNANSTLIPDRLYRIRLVIGDYGNPDYDSAVFIDSGNFITPLDLGPDINLCSGNSVDFTTNLDDTEFTHAWTLDGTPQAETSNTLTATLPGTYVVTATKNNCVITDSVVISDLSISPPNNIPSCDDGSGSFSYDLSSNNESVIGIDDTIYDIHYFSNQADIPNNPITAPDISNYISAGNETIYIKIYNSQTDTYCDAELPFNLTVDQEVIATEPNDLQLCNTSDPVNTDLTDLDDEILGTLDPLNYTVTYYNTVTDAQNNQNQINPNLSVSLSNSPQTVWAAVHSNSNSNCFDVVSFEVIINPLPVVATHDNVLECTSYILPTIDDVDGDGIPDGDYYDATGGPNGTGTLLNAGDVIPDGGTYYIYNGPDANGCFNESSFTLTFIDEYTVQLFHCGEFSVPVLPPGDFYTETDGPNGTGTLIDPATLFTSSDLPLTVHYYAETIDPITGVSSVCRNESFDITIYDLPLVDELDDIITCVDYTFEPLTNGNYFSNSGGTGTAYSSGNTITTSGTYYIYNEEPHNLGTSDEITCTNESSFNITIINAPENVDECDSYTLPVLENGSYFNNPNGSGTEIPSGTEYIYDAASPVNNTYNIYVYTETTPTVPPTANCTNNYMFTLTLYPTPEVDELGDVNNEILRCEDVGYTLNPLNNGSYYDGPGGPTMATQVPEGTVINSVGLHTYYIYNEVNGCPAESSFTVEIRELPLVDNFTDVFVCEPYQLPALTNGEYYTLPGGLNDPNLPVLEAGSSIDTTQTIYIYNNWDDINSCNNETVFTVFMDGVGSFDDVTACDNYTLQPLNIGKYYSASGANDADEITNFNYTFNPDPLATNIYTIFVANGDRFICETSFTLTISETPTLPSFQNQIVCGNYLLPDLDNSTYDVNYYSSPGGVDLITNLDLTSSGTHTIYVYATAFGNTNCFDEASFEVTIHPLLDLEIESGIICVAPETGETLQSVVLESNLNPSAYTIEWYLAGNLVGTGVNYTADLAGTYTVATTLINPVTPPQPGDCNYDTTEVEVTASSAAIATYTVTEDFADNAIITVNIIGGLGQYQYQLDNGPFQNSNIFENVISGDHSITIIDTLAGCNVLVLNVTVIKYPKFFTPNGDGYNDTWNIRDLSDQPNAEIRIFDRFGKFITQFSPADQGWDGTYNNRKLFASDYWFTITYKGRQNEDKKFKAHFSLKR